VIYLVLLEKPVLPMTTQFKLSAVGDILLIGPIIRMARSKESGRYDFASIIGEATPYWRDSDLVIGNLETPLAGTEAHYTQKNKRTGFTMFNCPDELAPALKQAGFHLLTTGNNHALDRGEAGVERTLKLLAKQGLEHTGTYSSPPGNDNHLIKEINGIRVGIISYSKSTNKLPLPPGKPWMVNVVTPASRERMLAHVRRLSRQVDLVIVCLHTGTEYLPNPPKEQRELVQALFASGAKLILGSHPHVLQPFSAPAKDRFVIHSLGNFISTRLQHNPYTNLGVILNLTIRKEKDGGITIGDPDCIPTWSTVLRTGGQARYKLFPIGPHLAKPYPGQSPADHEIMKRMWKHATRQFKGKVR